MTLGTRIFTMLHGRLVGRDAAGNRYYQERGKGNVRARRWLRSHGPSFQTAEGNVRARRWVLYAGSPEASKVPPEWHSWLHYTTEAPLPDTRRRPWQKPHLANLTGTPEGYRPPGHDYRGGRRPAATGDYDAWTPGS